MLNITRDKQHQIYVFLIMCCIIFTYYVKRWKNNDQIRHVYTYTMVYEHNVGFQYTAVSLSLVFTIFTYKRKTIIIYKFLIKYDTFCYFLFLYLRTSVKHTIRTYMFKAIISFSILLPHRSKEAWLVSNQCFNLSK